MSLENLSPYMLWGALICLVLVAIAIGVSSRYYHHARVDRYYILRETARRKGLRWTVVAFVSFVLCVAFFSGYLAARPHAPATPTPTITPSAVAPTASPSPSSTPRPTRTPSPTPTPTPNQSIIPTPAVSYPLPESALSPIEGAMPAGAQARITFRAFAAEQEYGNPVDPNDTFPPGDHRIYFFFEYTGMNGGLTWTYAWYKDGEYLDGSTCLWAIALEGCPRISGGSGKNFLFYKVPGGYEPGDYEVRVWIEDRFQLAAPFVIE